MNYRVAVISSSWHADIVAQSRNAVLAELDGVELVATRNHDGSSIPALEPGERLALRRRS